MKILFTGGSSFTGFWMIHALAEAGHDIVATFTRAEEHAYDGTLRGERVAGLKSVCRRVFACRFGDDRFLSLIREAPRWDVLCHHGADVRDYKSAAFDVVRALANNTHQLSAVLAALAEAGCSRLVLTGSLFEGGEGAGSEGLPHFSPYGLSKALTAAITRFHAERFGLRLAKFVVPNPFGPFEEARFTSYLVRTWQAGETAIVRAPAYVRDNIHVSLLARAYVRFAEALDDGPGFEKLNPSGYVESQGAFAERFAREMRRRLELECRLSLAHRQEFEEPRVRINTDPLDGEALGWDESVAWDELADYYERKAWEKVERKIVQSC